MKPIIVAIGLIATPAYGQYTCAEVRRAYVSYGAEQLRQWAKENQVTPAQRRAAIRCIHGKRIRRR